MPGGECYALTGSCGVFYRDAGEAAARRRETAIRRDSANGIDKVSAVAGKHHDAVGPSRLFSTGEVSAQPVGPWNIRTDHWYTRSKILDRLQRERCPVECCMPVRCHPDIDSSQI